MPKGYRSKNHIRGLRGRMPETHKPGDEGYEVFTPAQGGTEDTTGGYKSVNPRGRSSHEMATSGLEGRRGHVESDRWKQGR